MVPPDNQRSTIAIEFPSISITPEPARQSSASDQPLVKLDSIYLLDAFAAFILAIVGLPILMLSLLWVMVVDWGNPFFTQVRIGLDGKPYRIFKVRTMSQDHRGHARFCAHGDERILPGGHFLRKSRIDELPQLFNVLMGEMALVGPRPEQPTFVKSFIQEIPRYEERLKVKPGITGIAQISQGYVDSLDGTRIKLKYDLFFIRNRSLALWFFIVIGTVRVVLFRHGAR